MDMTGNVYEQTIGGWNFNYSGFTAASGDGSLTAGGAANTTAWPPTGGNGGGGVVRGAAWNNWNGRQISARGDAIQGGPSNAGRDRSVGGRGIRNY